VKGGARQDGSLRALRPQNQSRRHHEAGYRGVTDSTSPIDVLEPAATNCSGKPAGTLMLPVATGVTLDDLRDIIRKRT